MDVVALFQYGVDAGGGHARHRDHARPRRAAVPQRRRRVLLLRRRPRRARRRVEGGGVGAAAHEGRPPGLLPVPARRRGSGHASCARKARRFRRAAGAGDAAVASSSSPSMRRGREPRRRSKARRAWPSARKPLLAQIPDGAFGDLMKQRLDRTHRRRRARGAPRPTPRAGAPRAAARRARRRSAAWCAPRSRLLLQQPALARRDRAAVPVRRTAPAGHPAAGRTDRARRARAPTSAPARCSSISPVARKKRRCRSSRWWNCPATAAPGPTEFLDALAQLDRQTRQQRIDELNDKLKAGVLSQPESEELRELLGARSR